ncbi:ARID/BRIGHT DNA binding domain-containing protein [Reticulomyxa filosa]|uniref:ARID/BRIGHT DNA binding domain-containing protein n=1 Tax=Reticulomyxa filosa TaxID=46433 RepID=X6N3U0_RETFI|nr:ARID/BRIGHT DNA binding domain-containing protein [Reticulomyxa filosa]|eukprot:ETO20583.1 ARID/BRIGHT DNA binding domain-containing protein [Reticulomyxa filosa]
MIPTSAPVRVTTRAPTKPPVTEPSTIQGPTFSPTIEKKGNITMRTNMGIMKNGAVHIDQYDQLSITASWYSTSKSGVTSESKTSEQWGSISWTCLDCASQYQDLSNVNTVHIYNDMSATSQLRESMFHFRNLFFFFKKKKKKERYKVHTLCPFFFFNWKKKKVPQVSPPPRGGQCVVTPLQGIALDTQFELNCSGFESVNASWNSRLQYKYYLSLQRIDLTNLFASNSNSNNNNNNNNNGIVTQLGSGRNITIQAVISDPYNILCHSLSIEHVMLNQTFANNATVFLAYVEMQSTLPTDHSTPFPTMRLTSQVLQVLADSDIEYDGLDRLRIVEFLMSLLKNQNFTNGSDDADTVLTQLALTVQTWDMAMLLMEEMSWDWCVSGFDTMNRLLMRLLALTNVESVNCDYVANRIYSLAQHCALLSAQSFENNHTNADAKNAMYSMLIALGLATLQNRLTHTTCNATWDAFRVRTVQINPQLQQLCASDSNYHDNAFFKLVRICWIICRHLCSHVE